MCNSDEFRKRVSDIDFTYSEINSIDKNKLPDDVKFDSLPDDVKFDSFPDIVSSKELNITYMKLPSSKISDIEIFHNYNDNITKCRVCGLPYKPQQEFLDDARFFNVCNSCRMRIRLEESRFGAKTKNVDFWEV
jgi:hypothetical protein